MHLKCVLFLEKSNDLWYNKNIEITGNSRKGAFFHEL